MYKWILGVGAFLLFKNFFAAVIGFIIGSTIDNYYRVIGQMRSQAQAEGRDFTNEELFQLYQQRSRHSDFQTILMALSAAVMKADGKVLKAELDYVKAFFSQQFGPNFNSSHLQVLKQFLVELGFKVNTAQLASVDAAVDKTAISAAKLDASAAAASTTLSTRVSSFTNEIGAMVATAPW